ncbi:hypothetical protein MOQ72_29065 [Saccharopolyspora sp. K220]|uniref:hypothetical protein n=1 Tax=Saccharopolyspora soli TaxID=2926618 RepID=UPI001F574AE8|nr:hypothetical protein [Saccharopolyspora soli]MCI2421492.1 hypothetical protein [Saccharopolyspora soli]
MNATDTQPCTIGRCQRAAELGRYTCPQCAELMRRWLCEIEEYTAALNPRPSRGGNTGRCSPGYGSRPPARLDVIAALDPRSVPHAVGPDDIDGDVWSILGTLAGIAKWVADERRRLGEPPEPSRTPTIAGEVRYLLGRIDWCTRQPWVDDLAADLRGLHRQVVGLAGNSTQPLAPCLDCGGPLWPRGNAEVLGVRCGVCGATFDGLELLRLGAAFADRGAA